MHFKTQPVAEMIAAANGDRRGAERVRAAIKAIHYADTMSHPQLRWCHHCRSQDGSPLLWPCPTASALDAT